MASQQSVKTLGRFIPPGIFDKGLGPLLPEAYRKFYKEWKETEPTAVHYIPREGNYTRNEITGEVHPVQNIPIAVRHPPESHKCIWGGEGVVQGFVKKGDRHRRVPRFWMPNLHRSVLYSEVLNKHFSIVVTNRTISLVNDNYGFDHYLLKTPACDLVSLLALGMKRKILQDLAQGCPSYSDKPDKQKEVFNRYKNYLDAYTPEEIEWYGYSFGQACQKLQKSIQAQNQPVPLKQVYRSQLIQMLKEAGIKEAGEADVDGATTWLEKINPFGKKHET